MFFALLLVIIAVALATSLASARFFDSAVEKILVRILGEDLTHAWRKYVYFAILASGLSGGVHQWDLEKYLPSSPGKGGAPLALTPARWAMELFNTLTETLHSIALIMLLFFICSMMAYVVAKTLAFRKRTLQENVEESTEEELGIPKQ